MSKILTFCLTLILCACSTVDKPIDKPNIQSKVDIEGPDKYWTLHFFYFHKGKQTHDNSFHYQSRRDCFDAMYQMQVDSKKERFNSGAGVCSKRFVEGQKRTKDDVLGYR